MMDRQDRDQASLFYDFNLDDVFPANHLLRRLHVFVTVVLGNLYDELQPFYSDIGRPNASTLPSVPLRSSTHLGITAKNHRVHDAAGH